MHMDVIFKSWVFVARIMALVATEGLTTKNGIFELGFVP